MRTYIRRAVLLTTPLALASVLVTGCSDSKDSSAKTEPKKPATASADFEKVEVGEKAESPQTPAASAPTLSVGESGEFTIVDMKDASAKARMKVTVDSAKYATPTDVGTDEPAHGQYVLLTLTIKNVGKVPGTISTYGAMQWEDEKTAAQDATTLEIQENMTLDTMYEPGQSRSGKLVLDVGRKGGRVSYFADSEGPAFTVELPNQ
ncbi:DUF4352 domain-containing protein [Streptomyces sp. BA2]|uniref:DUF4352 domain-containing protein n=1 Tax=Streptomyces sp. BA2 TaxID=436595 RepID=UPI00132BCE1A|nr:DUF4352 domain-containing protein [Streptomyces sp. BA2]MWA08471.1 DUF4352 domain-containing protein [Streptomyces sp. BA2]